MRQIAKTLFSLWSLVTENAQINRITRHICQEHGLIKNCNHLEVVDGIEPKERNTVSIYELINYSVVWGPSIRELFGYECYFCMVIAVFMLTFACCFHG